MSAPLTRQIFEIISQENGLPLPQVQIDLLDTENHVVTSFLTGHESAQLPFTVAVTDRDTNLPLSGVTVCVTEQGFKQYTVTNACGEVFFSFPDTVRYFSISLKKDGYQTHSRCGVYLSGGYRRITMRAEHC